MKHFEITMKRIMEILLENEQYVTLEFLSQQVGISKRSVQNYLVKIEEWLLENNLKKTSLLKKQGYGIMFVTDAAEQPQLQKLLEDDKFNLYESSAERRIEIIKNLVFSNDELTIQFLADQFYVSRSVIICDLEWVGHWLTQYKLRLFKTQRRGIGIVGNEVSRRNAIAGFFDMCRMGDQSPLNSTEGYGRLAERDLHKLGNIYSENDIHSVVRIIEEAEKEFEFFLMEDYFTSLLTHITISIARLHSGNQVKKEFLPPDGEFPQLEMNAASFIAARLESTFHVCIPDSETKYICIHLIGYNTFCAEQGVEQFITPQIERLALQLIEAVDTYLGSNFISDKMLFFGISLHLKTSVYRMKGDIYCQKHRNLEPPENCADIYAAVEAASHLYERHCSVKANEEELVSLTYYFLLSQMRNTRKKKTILVCNYSIISQMEILGLINTALPNLEIIDVCSTYQFQHQADISCDFIISTVALDAQKIPVADLSHVCKGEYIKYLEDFIFSTFE
ncbi:PRD domain-containing protein [Oscillospiraceae bacterium PP1C4]